ncbi:hypothetical protein M434DRAFT_352446 [Hypoxylon sp. CO27-5]|nr:hypothetical protein M434DRAFT_352446 [Hypoxylon sp. CO27-5]
MFGSTVPVCIHTADVAWFPAKIILFLLLFSHTHSHHHFRGASPHTFGAYKTGVYFLRRQHWKILFLCEYKLFFAETRQAEDTPPLGEHICCALHTRTHSHIHTIYISHHRQSIYLQI